MIQKFFSIINLFLLYSVGFIGCLLIKNYYKLHTFPFLFLFLIFNFNGYFIEKFSAYGAAQLGYYFLPYIFYFLLRISKKNNLHQSYYWSILLGLFLTFVLMQGSIHFYVQMITFILFWSIVNYKLWRLSLLIFVTTFTTGLYRLLPSAVTYGTESNPHAKLNWGGYDSLEIFVSSLVSVQDQFTPHVFASWERSLYISIIGLLFLVYFSLWTNFIKAPWVKFKEWKYFIIPISLIILISFGNFKYYIVPDFIPLLNSESLMERYMIIPLILLTIIASINFQGFVEYYKNEKRINFVLIGTIGALALFLFNHSRLWRNHLIQNQFNWADKIYSNSFNLKKNDLLISNDNVDFLYMTSFWFGLVITFVSLVFFIRMLLKLRNKKHRFEKN